MVQVAEVAKQIIVFRLFLSVRRIVTMMDNYFLGFFPITGPKPIKKAGERIE
jgi:hypothetical protein